MNTPAVIAAPPPAAPAAPALDHAPTSDVGATPNGAASRSTTGENRSTNVDNEVRKVARDSLVLTVGLLATWALSLGVRVALPKFLSGVDFGQLIFAESLSLLVLGPLTLGLDTYARREIPRDPEVYPNLARGLVRIRVVVWLAVVTVTIGLLAVAGQPMPVIYLFGAFSVAQLAFTSSALGAAFLQGGGRATAVTVVQIAAKVLWAVTVFVCLALGLRSIAVPVALAVAEGLRLLWQRRANQRQFGKPRPYHREATRAALRASLPFVSIQIGLGLSNSLDTTMVGFIAGEREVGFYGIATIVASTALFLAPAIGAALLPALARVRLSDGDEAVGEVARAALILVLAVTSPACLLLVLHAPLVVTTLFGADYAPAIITVRILTAMAALTYVATIANAVLVAVGRSWVGTAATVVTIAVNAIANAALLGWATRTLGPGGTSEVAAWTVLCAEAVTVVLLLAAVGRRLLRISLLSGVLWAALLSTLFVAVHHWHGRDDLAGLSIDVIVALAAIAVGALPPLRRLRAGRHHPGNGSFPGNGFPPAPSPDTPKGAEHATSR